MEGGPSERERRPATPTVPGEDDRKGGTGIRETESQIEREGVGFDMNWRRKGGIGIVVLIQVGPGHRHTGRSGPRSTGWEIMLDNLLCRTQNLNNSQPNPLTNCLDQDTPNKSYSTVIKF